jgi:hypothetical protein
MSMSSVLTELAQTVEATLAQSLEVAMALALALLLLA